MGFEDNGTTSGRATAPPDIGLAEDKIDSPNGNGDDAHVEDDKDNHLMERSLKEMV
jgi:hypothetical protein